MSNYFAALVSSLISNPRHPTQTSTQQPVSDQPPSPSSLVSPISFSTVDKTFSSVIPGGDLLQSSLTRLPFMTPSLAVSFLTTQSSVNETPSTKEIMSSLIQSSFVSHVSFSSSRLLKTPPSLISSSDEGMSEMPVLKITSSETETLLSTKSLKSVPLTTVKVTPTSFVSQVSKKTWVDDGTCETPTRVKVTVTASTTNDDQGTEDFITKLLKGKCMINQYCLSVV